MSIDECLDKCDQELREAIENVIDTAGTSEAHWWILEAAGNAVLAERDRLRALLEDEDRVCAIAVQDIRFAAILACSARSERETRRAAIRAYRADLLAALDKEDRT